MNQYILLFILTIRVFNHQQKCLYLRINLLLFVEGVLVSGAAVSALLGVLDVEGFAGDGFRVVDDEGDVVDDVDGVNNVRANKHGVLI